ncbi:MAG: phosphoenolpyruvate carboxylase, partial [Planctomycetota bacterium]
MPTTLPPTETNHHLVESGLESLDARVKEIMSCLQEVIASTSRPEMAAALPWLESSDGTILPDPTDTAKVYSIAFQLLDMIEDRVALQSRRERERTLGPEAEKGLWPRVLHSLKESGFGEEEIAEAMNAVRVEPVFTAHPTEAKRPSVRERHRDLYYLLNRLENPAYSPQEKDRAKGDLLTAMEGLWSTGEIHVEKPTVERELRNALYYLREVFPTTVDHLDRHLAWAWKKTGFDPDTLTKNTGPTIRFALWIGGDRDGHPFVTADVTRDTLTELRRQAIKLYGRELAETASHLTISSHEHPTPAALSERISALTESLGDEGRYIEGRNPEEPWRRFAYLLRASIRTDESVSPASFRSDLDLLHASLAEIGAHRLASRYVAPLLRKLDVFGFHLAELDVRQNSAFHDRAAAQLLAAAEIEDGENFPSWSEEKRLQFLSEELQSPRPFLHADRSVGDEADAVRDCYRVLVDQRKQFGAGVGALIVSMTRQLSDLLLVHLFAREAGLTERQGDAFACPLQVVPLFETLDDLENGAGIVDAYLSHPVSQSSLGIAFPDGSPTQQIMLGYSDSNKDGGILASQWALHHAQQSIAAVGKKHDTEIRFFHGRGGTISRGAGPTNWFMRALPHGSLGGDFRMTEQGETIAKKYAYPENASYHLESLLACVTHATVRHRLGTAADDPGLDLMPDLAEWSTAAYRDLLETERFIEFYRQATPIDALEQTQMGSRPSRRTGTASLDDLRAIPWVFSWTQARFYLPGWYGVGSALRQLRDNSPESFERLRRQIGNWSFMYYVLTNVETNIASADASIFRDYAALVDDKKLRSVFSREITT